jgi:nucleoside-diphosphate-sugar epimerase
MLYSKDAALAADLILQAPKESIKMMNYNVGGVPAVTPKQIELAIKKHIPDVVVTYQSRTEPAPPMPRRAWDDSYARSEWGWRPEYDTIEKIVTDFIQEMRVHPDLYGVS